MGSAVQSPDSTQLLREEPRVLVSHMVQLTVRHIETGEPLREGSDLRRTEILVPSGPVVQVYGTHVDDCLS